MTHTRRRGPNDSHHEEPERLTHKEEPKDSHQEGRGDPTTHITRNQRFTYLRRTENRTPALALSSAPVQFECVWFFSTGLRAAQSNVDVRLTKAEPQQLGWHHAY
eukprot:7882698-Pyramimonas_sp.AAC.1